LVEDRPANPLIYLIHIQKTSGTALRAYFRRGFGFDKCLFHGPEVNLQSIAAMRPDAFCGYSVIGGHVGFGEIPETILAQSPVFVSAIRDPVARVISHYQHIRNDSGNGMHIRLANRTLCQAMRLPLFAALADRMQIEFLCGRKDLETLYEAMRKNRYIIGKQEKSQKFFDHLSLEFGIKTFPDLRVNVGAAGYEEEIRAQPDYEQGVERIREMNRDEYEFYESFGAVWSNV
jgi:hypothetical protein